MNFKTLSFEEAFRITLKYRKGVKVKFTAIEHNANNLLLVSPFDPSFSSLDYMYQ